MTKPLPDPQAHRFSHKRHDPIHGGHYLWRGLQIIFKPGFKRFVFVPLALNFIVYIMMMRLGYHYSSIFIAWIDHFLPDWLSWMNWLIWPFLLLLGLVFIVYSYGIVASMITAPFNSFLAEKVEHSVTHKPVAEGLSWRTLLQETPRALAREGQKILYYLPRVIILMLISFIPGINIFSSILWLLFAAWMTAVQYLDYALEGNNISFKLALRHFQAHRFSNIGFGALVLCALVVPIVNMVMIPAAVAGGTLKWLDEQSSADE